MAAVVKLSALPLRSIILQRLTSLGLSSRGLSAQPACHDDTAERQVELDAIDLGPVGMS